MSSIKKLVAVLASAVAAWWCVQGARAAVIAYAPSPIGVPSTLRWENASIEPSGVVWAAALDRYLVISDDAGTEDRKHRPWVFAMNAQGAFDDAPVAIQGIDELNDPESICSGPDGTFFLATSHSLNHKGKAKPARRALLHLRVEGRALRVLGRVDLTTAQDGKGGGLLSIAGLDPGGALDIEALTYQRGALLIGLKSPLTARGSAVILRLEAPVEALRAGLIPPGALTRFRDVDLRASRPGGSVERGISDLTTLPDGSILLCANSPKGMPNDGGGALFWLKPGAGAPQLLHDFPGLKPEGVTLAKDGKELVLVFDNDLRPPLWARGPLPR
jgi:phytase-like protein